MVKSWMTKNRMSSEYELGVKIFIEFGLRHDNSFNSIKCPCLKCGNRVYEDVTIVRYHLYINGIYQSYKIRFWHGKDLTIDRVPDELDNNPNDNYEEDDD